MNETDISAFEEYWRTITRNEDFIRQYGTFGSPEWEDKWHQDLEDAYSRIRPLLNSVTQSRMFHDLPGDINPFDAENYHHALVKLLNPPERWFGKLSLLVSSEYLSLKQRVEEEETAVLNAPIEGLSDTEIAILRAMDEKNPLSLKEIAEVAKESYDFVRRHSTHLQKAKLIKKSGSREFVRLIPLARLPR